MAVEFASGAVTWLPFVRAAAKLVIHLAAEVMSLLLFVSFALEHFHLFVVLGSTIWSASYFMGRAPS